MTVFKEGDSSTSPGNLYQCSVILIVQKCFLMFKQCHLCFSLWPLPLVVSMGTSWKSLTLSPFHTPFRSFSESCFLSWVSSDVLVHGVIFFQLQDFALLVQLPGVPVGLFLQPVKLPQDRRVALWPLLSVLCHLHTGWVYTLHHHLMKVVNRIKPSIDPWGTLPATGFQLDFMPLITTLWAWPISQFLVHLPVCSSSLYFSSFPVRILWKTVGKPY